MFYLHLIDGDLHPKSRYISDDWTSGMLSPGVFPTLFFRSVSFLLNEYLKRGFLFGKQVLGTRLFALWVSQPRSLGCGKSVAEMIKHRSGQRHQLIL
jgi:hypothetical protein